MAFEAWAVGWVEGGALLDPLSRCGSGPVAGEGRVTERLLTSAELGELLGFAAGTVVDWAERGTIPAFKLGGRLRFRESEVLEWLEARG